MNQFVLSVTEKIKDVDWVRLTKDGVCYREFQTLFKAKSV